MGRRMLVPGSLGELLYPSETATEEGFMATLVSNCVMVSASGSEGDGSHRFFPGEVSLVSCLHVSGCAALLWHSTAAQAAC